VEVFPPYVSLRFFFDYLAHDFASLIHFFSQQWLDSTPDNRSLSPQNNSDFSSAGGSPPMGHLPPIASTTTPSQISDDEIIPTAIVIKNIPFNVKRETLLDIIVRRFHLASSAERY